MKIGSKRRRTKEEIDDQKNEDRIRNEALQSKWDRLEKMERELEASKEKANNFEIAQATINDLIKKGLIRQNSKGAFVGTKGATGNEDVNMK